MSYSGQTYIPPTNTSFTNLNVISGASITSVGDAISLVLPSLSTAGTNVVGQYMTPPAAPYCAIANLVINQGDYVSTSYTTAIDSLALFGFYDGTKLVVIQCQFGTTHTMVYSIQEYASVSAATGITVWGQAFAQGQPSSLNPWLQIRYDGTNIYFYVAQDSNQGLQQSHQWILLYSQGVNSYLTGVPYVFWGGNDSLGISSKSTPMYFTLNSFQIVKL